MSQVESNKEYKLIISVDEEKGLLEQYNEDKLGEDISSDYSICDSSSIQVSCSHIDGDKSCNGVSTTCLANKSAARRKPKKKVSYQMDQKNGIVEKVKYFVGIFSELIMWKRQYYSSTQVNLQIVFDGVAAALFAKQWQYFSEQRQIAQNHQFLLTECQNTLSTHPTLFYTNASANQKVICKGYLHNDTHAITHINQMIEENKNKHKKNIKNILQYNQHMNDNRNMSDKQQLNNTFTLHTLDQDINIQFEKDFIYKHNSLLADTSYNKNLLTSIAASFISIFTGDAFKSQLNLEGGLKSGCNYYFFGKKVSTGAQELLQVFKVFKEFDNTKFKADQIVYLISMLVASGISLYFVAKLIKHWMFLAKKKTHFKRK